MEIRPTTLDAIRAILKEIEKMRPKTFLLFHSDDFFKYKDQIGITFNQVTGEYFYNEMRIIYSIYAEKGLVRELPISILENAKVTFENPVIGWENKEIYEIDHSIKMTMKLNF